MSGTYLNTQDGDPVQASNPLPAAQPVEWTALATSAANTEATATKIAEAGKKHVITGYLVVLRAAAAGNDASAIVKDGTDAKITDYIGNAAPRGTRILMTGQRVVCSTNTAANLVVAAAGSSAITELNLFGYTIDA